MTKQALATIAEHNMLAAGDGVVAGLSGGADSVALTHFLCNLPDFCLKIVCVHMHHGLRGREADEDADFCEDFCEQLGIELVTFRKDVAEEARKMGVGVEEAGRILRYDCFEQVLQQRGFSKIAVAHNQNDVTETIVMHIIRGTGGIRGIPPVNGNVIRPLIEVSRKDILAYCQRHELAYCTDSTNNSNDYTRNWIRNYLLPQIENRSNPSVGLALWRLADIYSEEDAFLDNIAKNACETCVKSCENGVTINLETFGQHDAVIKRRIARIAMAEAFGGVRHITYGHIKSLMALAQAQSGKRISLPGGYTAEKLYNEICIRLPLAADSFSVTLAKNTPVYVPQIDSWVHLGDEIIRENAFTKALDCGKITDVLIRSRLPGDRIYFNNVGTKKIKDFFTDKKIVRPQREKAVFIACQRDIILIMGEGFAKPIESHKFEPENHGNTIYLQIWKKS